MTTSESHRAGFSALKVVAEALAYMAGIVLLFMLFAAAAPFTK
ncbi:MAG TPA: hypothetical protein VG206_12110 [Terriglobia bacterium]|nr:hypothetical protein [Terriglobia bacterium]